MEMSIGHLDAARIAGLHDSLMAQQRNPSGVPKDVKRAEGAALKRLWDANPPMTQARFSVEVLERSEGYLPQLFKGDTPLDLRKARLFAKELKCEIERFSPRLAAEDAREKSLVKWPFPNVPYQDVGDLTDWEVAELEGKIRSFIMKRASTDPASGGSRTPPIKSGNGHG